MYFLPSMYAIFKKNHNLKKKKKKKLSKMIKRKIKSQIYQEKLTLLIILKHFLEILQR